MTLFEDRARLLALACACMVAILISPHAGTAAGQALTSPRLRPGAALPALPQAAVGGGEVVLEVDVDARGAVTRVIHLRTTPPYDEVLTDAVRSWTFEAATARVAGRYRAVPARVLVAALFRPPSLYAGPTAGAPPRTRAHPSPGLPQIEALSMPAYPPNAVGDGIVLIEIEMTARAARRGYRVVSQMSGFDRAALDAVSSWRFTLPAVPATPDRAFVYAVLGFRAPLVFVGQVDKRSR